MGKWTEIAKRYDAATPEPGIWREGVNKLKDDAKTALKIDDIKLAYRNAREEKEVVEATLSTVNAKIAAFEELLAEDAKATERDGPYYFDDGARVEVSDQLSVKCADNDAVLKWVKANELDRLLSVNPARLASLTKDAIENGSAVPDGVAINSYQQVKYVGPRKKK